MSVTWQMYVDFIKAKGNVDECMIVDAEDCNHWASTAEFMLREYTASIIQEDGTDKDEVVNEAVNLLKLMGGNGRPSQGLRLNGGKKFQILRAFQDEEANTFVVYGKITKGGCCIAKAGKCIIVGTFDELKGHSSAGCNEVIVEMAKYLLQITWPEGSQEEGASSGGMSASAWQPFIETMLLGKGDVERAIICSSTDGTVWASTPDFTLKTYEAEIAQEDGTDLVETVDEAKNIVQLMKGGPKPAHGLRLNQEKKMQILRAFEDDDAGCYMVYGKKMKGGACVAVSNTAIIIATFNELKGHTSSGCNTNVSELVKYLKSVNA